MTEVRHGSVQLPSGRPDGDRRASRFPATLRDARYASTPKGGKDWWPFAAISARAHIVTSSQAAAGHEGLDGVHSGNAEA